MSVVFGAHRILAGSLTLDAKHVGSCPLQSRTVVLQQVASSSPSTGSLFYDSAPPARSGQEALLELLLPPSTGGFYRQAL